MHVLTLYFECTLMKTLTIRNVSPTLVETLALEKQKRGTSLNSTVIDLLNHALGVGSTSQRKSNGLAKLAGKWSAEEFAEFESSVADLRVVDDEIWQ